MKLLTITIPCYNSQDYMEKSICSALTGGDRVEIIIVDDGSSDNTLQIAKKYEEKFPNIVRVIHQENGGHGEAVNTGIKNATGLYFKVVDSDDCLGRKALEKVLNLSLIHIYCTHPVLPKIFDLIKIEDAFFLVMEYIDGIDLKKYVDEYGTLSTKMLVKVMEQVCSGFYYLHSLSPAIVYRDLKPANIILCKDGRIKLIDFGIAKRYRTDIDVDKLALGSKGFAAPEQFGDSLSLIHI